MAQNPLLSQRLTAGDNSRWVDNTASKGMQPTSGPVLPQPGYKRGLTPREGVIHYPVTTAIRGLGKRTCRRLSWGRYDPRGGVR